MKKQRGYIHGVGALLIALGIVCGLIGWVLIELLIWLAHHINISWVN